MQMKKSEAGFTLIELLIVVVIVAILAAISIPAYTDNVKRSRRADARSVLMQNAQFMQGFLTANDKYNVMRDGTAVALPIWGESTSNKTDVIAIQAVPRAGGKMANDACATYTINNVGARGLAGAPTMTANDCWTK